MRTPNRLVQLFACLLIGSLAFFAEQAQAGAQDGEKADWKAVEAAASSFSRETSRRANRSEFDVSIDALARKLRARSRPEAVFDWMRENVKFEPYDGHLRGPRGVLVAGRANSADQAVLAAEILRAAGHTVRFARGTTYDADAEKLLKSFMGKATLVDPKAVASGEPLPATETGAAPRFAQLVRDHVWVEVKTAEKWMAFDPILAPTYGVAKAKMREITETLSDLEGNISIEVHASLKDGQTRKLLSTNLKVHEIGYSHVSMTFVPDRGRKDRFHAVMSYAGKTVASPESLPKDSIETLRVDFSLRRGRVETRFSESLIDPSEPANLFDYDQQIYDISIFPGWTSFEAASYFGDRAISSASKDVSEFAKAARQGESHDVTRAANRAHRALGFVLASAYSSRVDRIARSLAHTMGIVATFTEPRIVTSLILRRGSGYDYRMNSHGEGLTAIPKMGVPLAAAQGFASLMGYLKHGVEADLLKELSGQAVFTVEDFFELAQNKSVPVRTLGPSEVGELPKLGVSARDRSALRNSIRRKGHVVLTTSRDIEVHASSKMRGWWSLDPVSGVLHGSLGETMTTTDSKPATNTRDDAVAIGTLALTKRLRDAVDTSNFDPARTRNMVCDARQNLETIAGAFCATSAAIPLPDARKCVKAGKRTQSIESTLVSRASCTDRTRDFRCGVTVSTALITGDLTAMHTRGGDPLNSVKKSREQKESSTFTFTCP